MISEIDEALRAIVREDALAATDVEVVFDAPTTDWAARRNAPTVNLYLYDLREDPRWRQRGLADHADTGGVVARQKPARLFKLTYLVTAWTQRPEDEHRLLDGLLSTLVQYESLPASRLTGPMAQGRSQPLVAVAMPPEDRGSADVWTSLGGQLKPSIELVITAPLFGEVLGVGPLASAGLGVTAASTTTGGQDERREIHSSPPAKEETPSRAKKPTASAKKKT